MTTEEKARAYDEAIKVAKEWHTDAQIGFKANLETLFPELKESEDEKIRKEILSFLKEFEKDHYRNLDFSSWIAWLEKQEHLTTDEYEQGKEDVLWCIKQARKNAKDENDMGTCWFAEKWLEKQGERKSVDDLTQQEAMDIAVEKCFEQGEHKPRFNIGDIIPKDERRRL